MTEMPKKSIYKLIEQFHRAKELKLINNVIVVDSKFVSGSVHTDKAQIVVYFSNSTTSHQIESIKQIIARQYTDIVEVFLLDCEPTRLYIYYD